MPAHYLHNSHHNRSCWVYELPLPVQCLHRKSTSQKSFIRLVWSEGRISHSFCADTHTCTLKFRSLLSLFSPHSLTSCLWLYSSSQSWTSVFHGEVRWDVRLDKCARDQHWLWQSAGIPIGIVREHTSRVQNHYVTMSPYCWLSEGVFYVRKLLLKEQKIHN